MRDITIKITGKQLYDGAEEDQMEFITDGRLYQRNGYCYLIYDESEISGMEGLRTTIRFNDKSLRMKRTGKGGPQSELYFEEGRRFMSNYETPEGSLGIEVLTTAVRNLVDKEAGKGRLDVEYDISLDGMAEGRNRITIDLM
ncbi:MAG: DUF1934 domain-containing protein [Firmicutes bacterium]|nr:DUF1934 domain-containing protein [Bacillota bacterium]